MTDSSKVVIIEPGRIKAIDGKEYYNDQRIIAGSPDDVEAYHRETRLEYCRRCDKDTDHTLNSGGIPEGSGCKCNTCGHVN